jgi:hypothetical protein
MIFGKSWISTVLKGFTPSTTLAWVALGGGSNRGLELFAEPRFKLANYDSAEDGDFSLFSRDLS